MADERSLRQQVASRARYRCEYCQFPQHLSALPFQIDHVIAEKHEGETSFENLAYACLYCNRFKGPNIAGRDRESGHIVRLFDPRNDRWSDHFEWEGPVLKGRTAVGRATIVVLRINLPYRVTLRRSLIEEGRFPPQ